MFSTSYSPKEITNHNRNIEHLFYRYNISTSSQSTIEEISIAVNLNLGFLRLW